MQTRNCRLSRLHVWVCDLHVLGCELTAWVLNFQGYSHEAPTRFNFIPIDGLGSLTAPYFSASKASSVFFSVNLRMSMEPAE
jgi:hypothetical protein